MSKKKLDQDILDEAEAIRCGQLLEFIAQEQRRGVGSARRRKRKLGSEPIAANLPKFKSLSSRRKT